MAQLASNQQGDEDTFLPADFVSRIEKQLRDVEARRARSTAVRRWRWLGFVVVPVVAAACWAALPWTFGDGMRALIGFASYFTVLLAVANRANASVLSYLGLGVVPTVVDVLLLIGVVSWLAWASRSSDDGGAVLGQRT